ncbi:hypothetical protein HDU81_001839 [Chytriomyces hyalinus]|nr:hypothetical protein HDU81_001839 [Chytriomyces hyalinus]
MIKEEHESLLGHSPATIHRPTRTQLLLPLVFIGASVLAFISGTAVRGTPAQAQHLSPQQASESPFNWTSCPQKDSNYKCGTLLVPLEYSGTDPALNTSIPIAVAMYKAQKMPRMGTITFNFGGPGGSGKPAVLSRGPALSELTGGHYDVLSFDPRGIGESAPIRCFESVSIHSQFQVMEATIGFPETVYGSKTPLETVAAYAKARAISCAEWTKELLPRMGTTHVARDMDRIREALGDSVLNFHGFSYGTMLGVVYSNMFPNHVGRVILDGVMNPLTYMGGPIFKDTPGDLQDSDALFEAFALECDVAGRERCPLSSPGRTPTTSTRIRQFLKKLEKEPLVVTDRDAAIPFVLTAARLSGFIYQMLYTSTKWASYSKDLAKAVNDGNATSLINRFASSLVQDSCALSDASGENGMYGVTCLDTDGNDVGLEEWNNAAEDIDKVSPLFGKMSLWGYLPCRYWKVKPTERYTGPWNHTLKNKILLIGNSLDIVTPLKNAQTVERIMEGNAVLLHHDGYGHCSTSQKSTCTINAVKAFYTNGTYPDSGTMCPYDRDVEFFPVVGETTLLTDDKKDAVRQIQEYIVAVNA